MPPIKFCAALTCTALAAALAPAAAQAEAMGCLITPSKIIELGSASIGVVQAVNVERGDVVKAGQVLATLRNGVERANLELATSRADAEAELNAAAKALDLAQRKLERTQDLFRQQFVSAQAVDQALADVEAAQARRAQAKELSAQARKEVLVASAQLDSSILRSPIDGIVVDVYRHPGERVEEKPLLKIAAIRPLNVEVVLPASMYRRLKVGDSAMIQPSLPGEPAVAGTVRLLDRVLDPASNTLRARIELANANGSIPAGQRCQLLLPDAKPAIAPAATFGANAPATGPTPAPARALPSRKS